MQRCPNCGEILVGTPQTFSWEGWKYNERDTRLHFSEDSRDFISLEKREGELLCILLRAKGEPRHAEVLYGALYSSFHERDQPALKVITVMISNVRARLRNCGFPSAILTLRGRGWFLQPPDKAKKPLLDTPGKRNSYAVNA